MFNYSVTKYLAQQHRDELLREAQQERVAQEATSDTANSTLRLLYGVGQRMVTLVQRASSAHPVATTSDAPSA